MKFGLSPLALALFRSLNFVAAGFSSDSALDSASDTTSNSASGATSDSESTADSLDLSRDSSSTHTGSSSTSEESAGEDPISKLRYDIIDLKFELKEKKRCIRLLIDDRHVRFNKIPGHIRTLQNSLSTLLEDSTLYPTLKMARILAMSPSELKKDYQRRYRDDEHFVDTKRCRRKIKEYTGKKEKLKSRIEKKQGQKEHTGSRESHKESIEDLKATLGDVRKKIKEYRGELQISANMKKCYKSITELPLDKIVGEETISVSYKSCIKTKKALDRKRDQYDELRMEKKEKAEVKSMYRIRDNQTFKKKHMDRKRPIMRRSSSAKSLLRAACKNVKSSLLALVCHRLYKDVFDDYDDNFTSYIPQNLVRYLLKRRDPRSIGYYKYKKAFIRRARRPLSDGSLNSGLAALLRSLFDALCIQDFLLEYLYTKDLCKMSDPNEQRAEVVLNQNYYPAIHSIMQRKRFAGGARSDGTTARPTPLHKIYKIAKNRVGAGSTDTDYFYSSGWLASF